MTKDHVKEKVGLIKTIDKIDKDCSKMIQNMDFKRFEYFVLVWGCLFTDHHTIWIPSLLSLAIAKYYSVNSIFILFYCLQIPVTALICYLIKNTCRRIRPSINQGQKRRPELRTKQGHSFSFPSGDALQAGIFSTFFYMLYGNSLYLFVYPFVAFARVYYKWHWIGDTIFGGAIGITFGYYYFLYMINTIISKEEIQ